MSKAKCRNNDVTVLKAAKVLAVVGGGFGTQSHDMTPHGKKHY